MVDTAHSQLESSTAIVPVSGLMTPAIFGAPSPACPNARPAARPDSPGATGELIPQPASGPNELDNARNSVLQEVVGARNSLRTLLSVESSILKVFQYKYYQKLREDFVIHPGSYAALGFSPLISVATADQLARFGAYEGGPLAIVQADTPSVAQTDLYTDCLNHIERQVREAKHLSDIVLLKAMSGRVSADFELRISTLRSTISRYISVVDATGSICDDLVSRIRHTDLRRQAETYLQVVQGRLVQIKEADCDASVVDIFQVQTIRLLSLLADVERYRLEIVKLLSDDKRKTNLATASMIAYIAIITAVVVIFGVWKNSTLGSSNSRLSESKLPVIGIPWPVLVWSLFGSFAAMLYRFNHNPISEFGDVVKWMVTRPAQGIVLGAAVYLVLTSGLNVLTSSGTTINDAAILIISFLVGFSDRFGDIVFNNLVRRYSGLSVDSQESDADRAATRSTRAPEGAVHDGPVERPAVDPIPIAVIGQSHIGGAAHRRPRVTNARKEDDA
jgi:hypothetical protein